jgi:serine/threonine protein kinase
MLYFSLGGIFLLIPSLFNLWIVRGHGPDLIIEGKEFNRLAKLAIKSFPFELHGIYKEPTFLGEGGFGRVFKATRSDGQDVAIKIPKTFDKRSEKTFIAEVNNWNKLEHPNIVKLYDYKILPIPFIEVEYCKDGSIGHGKMPLDDAINVIYQVAHALSYAHQKNIIHGDIKTGNILKSNGLYKISDWGLSKLKTEDSVTLSGATPQYAAPEQISREFGKADERTDIYQLGDVFYELVTGELPFTGEVSEIYGSILTRDPVPPADINPQATSVEPIIMKCLEKIKDDRYSSMDELIRSLEQLGPIKPPESDTIIYKDEDEQKD